MAVAVTLWAPETDGFQGQVATLLGDVPEVTLSLQLAMRFPLTKKRTIELVFTVAERVTLKPL